MKAKSSIRELTPAQYRQFTLPAGLSGLILLFLLLVNIRLNRYPYEAKLQVLIATTMAAAVYITLFNFFIIPPRTNKDLIIWTNAIISGMGLWIFAVILPDELLVYQNMLTLMTILALATFSGRVPTYFILILGALPHLVIHTIETHEFRQLVEDVTIPVITIFVAESIFRLQNVNRQQIHRLEIINEFSREINASLDRGQVILLLNSAIQKALKADTYYFGTVNGEELELHLFFDDDEYFNGTRVPLSGTLSGWVIENQKELFLPDLREEIQMEGVNLVVIGKERTSLSWIGVPLTSGNTVGIIALASYQPNAFHRGDIELLSNLAQHAALALENAARHAQVEERSRLDSMTGVYNHGYFLKLLQEHADEASEHAMPLSLIMLDVDLFKPYNDTYGHLIGDKVLNLLCSTIRSHIKSTDAIGRWGGEEFVISLPHADARQARIIAERISATMRTLTVTDREEQPVPAPTVSQGIAIFPEEADEIYQLIDLADRRLYIAKNRGRDQIEAPPE